MRVCTHGACISGSVSASMIANFALVLMVAQRKEIGSGYLGLKGTYRKITLIRVNRLINDKQIPPNLDLRKESSALCQNN